MQRQTRPVNDSERLLKLVRSYARVLHSEADKIVQSSHAASEQNFEAIQRRLKSVLDATKDLSLLVSKSATAQPVNGIEAVEAKLDGLSR